MSLLMDALKQAEEANDEKDQSPEDAVPESAGSEALTLEEEAKLSLELPEPEPIEENLEVSGIDATPGDQWVTDSAVADTGKIVTEEPDLADNPDSGEVPVPEPVSGTIPVTESPEPAVAQPAPAMTPDTAAPETSAPDAAAHVLSASRAYNRRRKTFLVLIFAGMLTGVACAVTAYWYWAQSRSSSQGTIPFTSAVEPDFAETRVDEMQAVPLQEPVTEVNAGDSSSEAPTRNDWQPAPVDPRALQVRVDAPVAAQTPPSAGESTLKFSRTRDHSSVQPALKSAYEAFSKRQYYKARDLYQKALQREPRNRDALLGLAAVSVKNDDFNMAAGYYHQLLELNPKDSAAHAGLTMVLGSRDPVASESQIKLLLDSQPDAAYLHFALGNVYSEQARWPEAQQAYFDAVRLDSENPDYAFNLAISLDRMSRHSSALRYYQTALSLGSTRTASFSPAAIRDRIRVLESMGTDRTTTTP